MARGYNAGENRSINAPIGQLKELPPTKYNETAYGDPNYKKDQSKYIDSLKAREATENENRKIVNKAVDAIDGKDHVDEDNGKTALRIEKMTDKQIAAFREKNGTIGDGKLGNGKLLSTGEVKLSDNDVAWMLSNSDGRMTDGAYEALSYAEDGDNDAINILTVRGLPQESVNLASDKFTVPTREIEISGSIDVSEANEDGPTSIQDASFNEDDIKYAFERSGFEISDNGAKMIALRLKDSYVGGSLDDAWSDERIKQSRDEERADWERRSRRDGN
jgi:hypothetical protein